MMESKKPRSLLSEKERSNQPLKTPPPPSKTKALIQHPKAKSKLKESLSKVRYRFLGRETTSFHFFPLLPKELQLLILVFALREGGEVVIAQPHPNGGAGWWSVPHSFLNVNSMFRQQTQVLRQKAFALVEKPLAGSGASTAHPEDLARVRSLFLGRFGTVATPAHIDFDFKLDTLAISSKLLWSTLSKADVPDLKKIDAIVISWVNFDGFPQLVDCMCQRYPNIRNIGLVHQSLLDRGLRKTHKGKNHYFTTSGPFLRSEVQMKESLEWNFDEHASMYPGTKVPRVISLRVARDPEKICKLFPRAFDIVGRWKDALVIMWAEAQQEMRQR
jgi:hypothetical protein